MRTRTSLLAVLGLAATMIACDDGGTGSETTTAPTTTTVAATTTIPLAELEAMLIEVGDLGDGWQLAYPVTQTDLDDFRELPCTEATLPPAADALTPLTGVQFEPTDDSAQHLIELVFTGEPEQLSAGIDAFVDATLSCDGHGISVGELALPTIGDQTRGFLMTGVGAPEQTATWYIRGALLRVGGIAIALGVTELLDSPDATPMTSDDDVVALLEIASARLSG